MIVNGITFQVSKEFIYLATGIDMMGRKWKKVTRVMDKPSLNHFFQEGEEPVCHHGGFLRDKLLSLGMMYV